MKNKLREGSLVKVVRRDVRTLSVSNSLVYGLDIRVVRETIVQEQEVWSDPKYEKVWSSLEGKVGLIVYVIRNKLDQPVGYKALFEGIEMFFKSKVAEKYFELSETKGNEHR